MISLFRFKIIAPAFLAALILLLPLHGFAEEVTPSGGIDQADLADGKITIDFHDADIRLFVKFMAELTGRNFIIDEKVQGKVTVISPKEVNVDEAIKVFESTMEVYGFTLIEAGNVTKVVPSHEARQRGSFGPGGSQSGDKIITRLIPMQYVKAPDMVDTLRPLLPITSFISAFKGTNTLIIVDFASNVNKLRGIINKLDVPGQEQVITVAQLTHAGARELSDRLVKIFDIKKAGGSPALGGYGAPNTGNKALKSPIRQWSEQSAQIIPDERVNAVIIVANNQMTKQALSLIEQLDIPAQPGQGKINVYYLKNADAEDLAKVLGNLTQEPSVAPGKGRKNVAPINVSKDVTITPDKATNSLVITASREEYETLRKVIEKLDIRRRQVFVEALIMEVTSDKQRELGIEWRTTSDFSKPGPQGIGGTNFGNINNVAENPLNAPQGLTVGVVDGIISFGDKQFLNLGALIRALQTESGVNILSTPNIMTTDNEEAKIVVAQTVPFVTGESQNTGGTILTTIERKDIGITLTIKPQISESEIVKLNVYQEISSISPTQLEKARDIITFTRSIETTVVAKDAQNIVLGGLIRDDINDQESKVPLFGDIPLLGWLFKSQKKRKQKTNLLVFLTPHIIKNDHDLAKVTDQQREIIKIDPEAYDKTFDPTLKMRDKSPYKTMDEYKYESGEDVDENLIEDAN